METSIRRVSVLVKKEIEDFIKNINVSVMCLLPVIFVYMFANVLRGDSRSMMSKIDLLNMGVGLNLIFVSIFSVCMLISEEKEKNTIRTLMLSSVSPVEFLAGKVIVILLFSLITNLSIYFIVGINMQYLGEYILWVTFVSIIMIQLGGIIGLIAPNQISTSVIGLPAIIGFLIIPILAPVSDILQKIVILLPNYNLQVLLTKIFNSEAYAHSTHHILVILVWLIVVSMAFVYTYNKKGLE